MTLKTRQPGQGGVADPEQRDLRAELLKAEAAHFAKKKGIPAPDDDDDDAPTTAKRQLEAAAHIRGSARPRCRLGRIKQ